MQFKTLNTILSVLFLTTLIQSSPIDEEKNISDTVEEEKEEEVTVTVEEEIPLAAKAPASLPELDYSIFPTEECLTDECYEISKRVLKNIDLSVDPCDDFYQFTCGGWIRDHPLQDGEDYINGKKLTSIENVEMIRRLLKEEYHPNDQYTPEEQALDEATFHKLKNVYNTCMDVDSINAKGSQPMLDLFHRLRIFENREKYASVEGFTNLIASVHGIGVPFLFEGSCVLPKNSNQYDFAIIENSSRMAVNLIKHPKEYKQYIHDTLQLVFHGIGGRRDMDAMTEAIVNLENELYQATKNVNKVKKVNNGAMSIRELNEKYPLIDWQVYVQSSFSNYHQNVTVTPDTVILNYQPHYFEALDKVLAKFSIDELVYYVEWSILRSFISYLSDDIRQPGNAYLVAIGSTVAEPLPREEFCELKLDEMMGFIVGKYFAERIFNEEAKTHASNTITYIKQAMINRIPQMAWLDDQTKEHAIEKVLKMTDRIGYPDYLMDPEKLAKEFEDFSTSPDDYFTNMINYDYYSKSKNIRLYQTEFTTDSWKFTPQTINASYQMTDNSINLPAGIFQSPYYRPSDPDYMNYGSIGMVAGHELTHGFDNNGRKYDADGKRKNWWTEESSNKFVELSQCFIEQYSEFSITLDDGTEVHCDGEKALAENLADNGGIARSYEAWLLSLDYAQKHQQPELIAQHNPLLPGLSDVFNYEQLFYISYGQGWCVNATPDYIAHQMQANVHSPAKFRVNGVVMNSEHFARVFHCPVNSPMNPKDKCSIW